MMFSSRECYGGLLTSLAGVVVGGLISAFVTFVTLDKQLSFQEKLATSELSLKISGIKHSLYMEFLDKYGSIGEVNGMDDQDWFNLLKLLAAFNTIDDKEVAKSVTDFYNAVKKVRGEMSSKNTEKRKVYFDAIKKIIESMKKSLGFRELEVHWFQE